ncbi:MAG TPA: hypothetical protein VFP71_07010 [Candidatus Angelobacter sp.]|jgi:hypothetical protein|nr:hypothetical protein [Candidatus Angelobacter sp.]
MLRLDYLSCVLTILSTVMVGRRKWQGWVVAGANSAIISVIGLQTGQWGFVPANAFCIVLYLYNVRKWRSRGVNSVELPSAVSGSPSLELSARLNQQDQVRAEATAMHRLRVACRKIGRHAGDERAIDAGNRIRTRRVPNQRESHTSR